MNLSQKLTQVNLTKNCKNKKDKYCSNFDLIELFIKVFRLGDKEEEQKGNGGKIIEVENGSEKKERR